MSFQNGHRTFAPTAAAIPASPPPEMLAEVEAAWARAAELAEQGLELHFVPGGPGAPMVVEVRTIAGEVLRTLLPSQALAVVEGRAPVPFSAT